MAPRPCVRCRFWRSAGPLSFVLGDASHCAAAVCPLSFWSSVGPLSFVGGFVSADAAAVGPLSFSRPFVLCVGNCF